MFHDARPEERIVGRHQEYQPKLEVLKLQIKAERAILTKPFTSMCGLAAAASMADNSKLIRDKPNRRHDKPATGEAGFADLKTVSLCVEQTRFGFQLTP